MLIKGEEKWQADMILSNDVCVGVNPKQTTRPDSFNFAAETSTNSHALRKRELSFRLSDVSMSLLGSFSQCIENAELCT